MEYVLKTSNLEKRYKNFKALDNLSINVEKGAIYGLVGKNGSGKTTLIRLVCGLQKPSNGSYSIYGIDFRDKSVAEVRARMGAIVETPSIYLEMTARDNLKEQLKIIGATDMDVIDEILELVGLKNTDNKRAKNFSLGMRQRLGIAVALVSNPDFLILDEPINGLDPQGIIEIRELILKLNKQKKITILVSSHYLDELSKIATHYGFLDNGSLIKEISAKDLMKKLENRIELKVDDIMPFVNYFEQEHVSYEVIDNNSINVYGKMNLMNFIKELFNVGLVAREIHENEETLENYYMNLIGGHGND